MIKLVIKKPQNIKNDLLSGLTVALALVPEAIAFSFVALPGYLAEFHYQFHIPHQSQ